MIESIYGVRQFLPLSNTFPPANRTNAFIIGDGKGNDSPKFLIDPSPKDENELAKFLKSVDKIGFDAGVNAKTPYTTNDLKKADEQVLTAAKFKTGRGGEINEKKYSDTLKK